MDTAPKSINNNISRYVAVRCVDIGRTDECHSLKFIFIGMFSCHVMSITYLQGSLNCFLDFIFTFLHIYYITHKIILRYLHTVANN
jgi:hypothetical protein